MSRIKSILSEKAKGLLKKAGQPEKTKPMLASLTHDYFSDSDWIYERKFDGERALCYKHGKTIELKSRNNKSLNDSYPEIVDAARKQKGLDFVIDGEVVAFDGNLTSFSRLQQRMHTDLSKKNSRIGVYYYVFDILYLDGYD